MSGAAPTFRGYHAICDVIARMEPLAAFYRRFKPEVCTLTLARRDLDLLQRWPKAAALHQVHTNEGKTYWRGFTLEADSSTPRYEKPWLASLSQKAIS